jgi:hypothetical protein
MLTGRCSLTCSFTHPVDRRDELPQLPSGAGGLIRSLRVNRLANRQDIASNIPADSALVAYSAFAAVNQRRMFCSVLRPG